MNLPASLSRPDTVVADHLCSNACVYDQLKALEGRTNAWDKRVNNARKARLQQEAELENKFELPPPPPSSSGPSSPSSQQSGPAPRVLSVEEMKAFELRNAQAQVGFNPYAAVISSSTEASTVMNSMSSSSQPGLPPPAPMAAAPGRVAPSSQGFAESTSEGTGGVFVLLRQDPARAITAAETIIKMLSNIQKNPQVLLVSSSTLWWKLEIAIIWPTELAL